MQEAEKKVIVANFGRGNYLWPECKQRSTVGEQIKLAKPKYSELQGQLPGFPDAQKPLPKRRKRRR